MMIMAVRHFGPRSLAGQLMLVLAVALMLAQGINLALLVQASRQERLASIAGAAAAQIGDAMERLEAGQPVGLLRVQRLEQRERDEEAGDARPERRLRRVQIGDAPRFRPAMRQWPELAGRVERFLADVDMPITEVRAASMAVPRRADRVGSRERGARLVAVAARLPDGRWLTVRTRTPENRLPLGELLLVQTAILFALLLVPLLWVAWRVSRPLKTLARAAADTRPGSAQPPVAESGPADVRDLTRAFNAMQQRIHAMLAEKDHMLGAVGHDLRTPLASLRVRVEQVADEPLRERMAATIAEMAAMLDDILSLARAGQPRERAESVDLAALAGELVADYRAMGRPVDLAADGALVTRTQRPASLRRALRNLIDNAVTYGGSATVGLVLTERGEAVLSVEDDGPGIPADRIEEMLEPFARAESSRNRNTGGSGLGLALAKALVVAEGGRLELGNRSQGGLTARIILPQQDC